MSSNAAEEDSPEPGRTSDTMQASNPPIPYPAREKPAATPAIRAAEVP